MIQHLMIKGKLPLRCNDVGSYNNLTHVLISPCLALLFRCNPKILFSFWQLGHSAQQGGK